MHNTFRSTKLMFLVILMFLFTGSFAYANFSDLEGHWAKDCINKWADNGVINGFNDGTVHPNEDITRAEFAKIINKVFNFTEKASKNYSDVERGQWYTYDFAKAKQAGYLKDFVDTKALPTEKLNREQAATILYNVLQMQTDKSSESKTFTDTYEISKYALEPVKVLYSKGLINGYPDGSFKPSNVIKRSEALKMVDNVIKGYFNKKGTYSNQKLSGSVIINTSGVTLKDVDIQGDLYLTEGIGEGEVTLQNVEVSGKTYINGGGENSVYFIDSSIEDVIVNKSNGKVRLVSKGKSNIKNVILESGAKLEEESITNKYNGFRDVEVSEKVPCEQDTEFSGDFEGVTISSSNELTFDDCDIEKVEIKGNDDKKEPTVKMLQATVKSLVSNAEGAKIEMKKGTKVESIALQVKTDLSVDKGAEVEKLSIDKNAKGTGIDIDGKVKKVANDATDVKANGKTIKKGSNVSTSTKSSSSSRSSSSHHSSGGSSSKPKADTTKPVIENVTSSNVKVSDVSKWEAPATKASDNKDGDITSRIKIAYTSDDSGANVTNLTSAREHLKTVENTVKVTYTVSDVAGNSAIAVVATFTAVDDNTGEEDTTAPVITGVENNKGYQTKVTPVSTDTDIKTVTLTKGDTAVSYKLGTDITEAGEYILTVTDNAGNITKISFTIKKASGNEIDFFPEASASLTENVNEISLNTHGIITESIDTSKLIYKTSKDATYGHALSDKYVLVDFKSDLKPGEYYYLKGHDDTSIYIKLLSEDAKAIKSLDGYGNVSYFVNDDNDILEAREGWYDNAEAGTKSVSISNYIKVNLKTSIQGGVYEYDVNGKSTGSRGFSGNEESNESLIVSTQTTKIVFYKGKYDYAVDPTSGEMKIIKYKDDFIENGITVDDSNWIPVTEDNFGKEDTTAPVITGVENNKEYQTKVTPVSTDTDIKTVTLTKGDTPVSYKLGTDITEAGEYILTVTDNAGNITKISFTIKTVISNEISFISQQMPFVDFAHNTNELRFTVNGKLTEVIDTSKFKYLDSEDANANSHTLQKYVKVDDKSKLVSGSYCYTNMIMDIDGKIIDITQIYLKLKEEDAKNIKKLEGLGDPNCYVGQEDILAADDGWYPDVKGGTKQVLNRNKVKVTFENTKANGLFSYGKNNNNFSSCSIKYIDDNLIWIDVKADKLIFAKDEYNYKLSGEIKIIKVTEDIINNGIVIDDKDWIDAPKLTNKTIDATHKILTLTFNKTIGFNDKENYKRHIYISKNNGKFIRLSGDDEVNIADDRLIITFKDALTKNDKIKIYGSTLKDKDEVAIPDVIVNVFDCSIDLTEPIITGVEDGVEYQLSEKLKKVTPSTDDKDINKVTLTKDGSAVQNYELGTDITEAGEYILTVTNDAGNTTEIKFSIKTASSDEISFNRIYGDFTLNTNELTFFVTGKLTEDIDTSKFIYLDSKDTNANSYTLQKYVNVDDISKLVEGSYCYTNARSSVDGKEVDVTEIHLKLIEEDANEMKKIAGPGNPFHKLGQEGILRANDGWYSDVKGGTKFINIGNKIKITFENTIPKEVFCYDKNNDYFSSSSINPYYDVVFIDEKTDKLIFVNDVYGELSGEIQIIEVTEDLIKEGIVIDNKYFKDAPKLTNKTINTNHKILTLTFNKKIRFNDKENIKPNISISTNNDGFTNLSDDDKVNIEGERLIITFKNSLTKNDKIRIYGNTLKDIDEVAIPDTLEINVFDCINDLTAPVIKGVEDGVEYQLSEESKKVTPESDDTVVVNTTGDSEGTFTPNDTDAYEVVTGTVSVTANTVKTTPVVDKEICATAVNEGETLESSTLTGTFKVSEDDSTTVPGTLTWTDDTTEVKATGDFEWTFTPTDKDAYEVVTGTVNVTVN